MRRLFKGLLVVSFVLSLTAAPAYAVPRRDDGDGYPTPLKKIEKIIKKIIKKIPLDEISWPRP
jgi:hypothetical protein